MSKIVTLIEDLAAAESWEKVEVDSISAFLISKYQTFPANGHIYHGNVALENDVTPRTEEDIERLESLDGEFYVVVAPGFDPGTWALIIAITVAVAAIVFMPRIPQTAQRNIAASSPNNELSARSNSARVNGRIPDIVGQVRSTPDLIAPTYSVFENNVEIQVDFMCIGRGAYDVTDVRDDTTKISQIFGSSVEIYAPSTSPNSGSPYITIGDAITYPLVAAARSNAVNGQTLLPDDSISVNWTMNFVSPDTIQMLDSSPIKFTDRFTAADTLQLTTPSILVPSGSSVDTTGTATLKYGAARVIFSSVDPSTLFTVGDTVLVTTASYVFTPPGSMGGTASVSANGTYKVSAVSSTMVTFTNTDGSTQTAWGWINPLFGGETPAQSVTLTNYGTVSYINLDGDYGVTTVNDYSLVLTSPDSVNAAWDDLAGLSGGATAYQSATVSKVDATDVGPFVLDVPTLTQVYLNFVALNGLYQDDGTNQTALSIDLQIDITPVNSSGTSIGSTETSYVTITGSSSTRDTIAQTIQITPAFTGRCSVKVTRITPLVVDSKSSIVQDIKWRDLYAISPITDSDFGNITTVYTKTRATAGALAVKNRKLNMLVTRKIPLRVSGSTFTSDLHATKRVDEIISFLCLDPRIGGRSAAEMDFTQIYATVADIITYFGSASAAEFCYTFDKDDMSFEQTISSVANSVFSTVVRRGSLIQLLFEKATTTSSILFNHRNKVPGTETRTLRFGPLQDYDGVQLQYVDPTDDSVVNLNLPADGSATKPQVIETIGIRNGLQAWFLLNRAYNKMLYQRRTSAFDAHAQANLVVQTERVLITDNTRPETQDGEVLGQSGLTLTLSQPADLTGGAHLIFLQHSDGTTESIGITAGGSTNQVVLASAPASDLALDRRFSERTAYMIVPDVDDPDHTAAYLITSKTPKSNAVCTLQATNYDGRYYGNDKDFINGVVDANGKPL